MVTSSFYISIHIYFKTQSDSFTSEDMFMSESNVEMIKSNLLMELRDIPTDILICLSFDERLGKHAFGKCKVID